MEPGRSRKLVTAALALAMFLAALEATAVGTAMPTVVSELGGVSRYSWVFSVYLLTSTTTVPMYGKLADLFVVRGNPLEDIKAARDIRFVLRDGIAYDPAELLQSAQGKIGPAGPNDHADWELELRPLRQE